MAKYIKDTLMTLSSAEASFALPCVLLGRVGNLEAGERSQAHLLFSPYPPSPPPRSLCGGESIDDNRCNQGTCTGDYRLANSNRYQLTNRQWLILSPIYIDLLVREYYTYTC